MADSFPAYPDVLKYETWDKKKALLTPETGIGKELKALKPVFDKVPGNKITILKLAAGPDELQEAIKEVKGYWPAITAAREALQKFSSFAGKKAAEAKKSKTFPAKSRELIEEMSNAASNLATAIRDTPDRWMKDAEKKAADYSTLRDKKMKLIDETLQKSEAIRKRSDEEKAAIEERLSECDDLVKAGQITPGKLKVRDAANLLATLVELVKESEDASKVWRTDKTVAFSKADSLVSKPKSDAIMTNNKAVMTNKKEAETKLKEIVKTLGAQRG
jgi:hypothetical protein